MSAVWLLVADAAERAGAHPETVREALRAGEMHGTQRGKFGTWRTREECVDAWVEGVKCPHLAVPVVSLAARRRSAS